MVDDLATRRYAARQHEDETADRIDLLLVLLLDQTPTDDGLELVQGRAGLDQPAAVALLRPEAFLGDVMLILDLADDLLDRDLR